MFGKVEVDYIDYTFTNVYRLFRVYRTFIVWRIFIEPFDMGGIDLNLLSYRCSLMLYGMWLYHFDDDECLL